MPSVSIALPQAQPSEDPGVSIPLNPFPSILHTPTGLAILELQGTFNTPTTNQIGNLVFNPDDPMKCYLYVGKHQRMQGVVQKLGKPYGVLRKSDGEEEELEIVDVVKYKVLFKMRPEPVT